MRPGEILRAISAGFFATLIMTIVMYALPIVGVPPMDILGTLGAVFPYDISPYILGALAHLGIGILLALFYAAFFYFLIPGPRLIRGMLFSLLPWLFAITLLGPSLRIAAEVLRGPSPAAVAQPRQALNPCAPAVPVNPCAPAAQPCIANPCGLPIQPCAAPAQPCGPASQPCAPAAQPCAPTVQPDAGKSSTPSGISPQMLSLFVHLIYGATLGLLYRP